MKEDRYFYCECAGCAVKIEIDTELPNTVWFFWLVAIGRNPLNRIKAAWNVLWRGEAILHDMVLSAATASMLATNLNEAAGAIESKYDHLR